MTVLILISYKLLLTREEAAEMLGIGLRKLDQLVARGDLKPRRIDDCVRLYIGELIQFASENNAELKSGENTAEGSNDHAA
jgi:hypothetical protein